MDDAKMSMVAQRELGKCMLTGAPIPTSRAKSAPAKTTKNLFGVTKNYYFSKRKRSQIESTGAYSPEPIPPYHPIGRYRYSFIPYYYLIIL